MTLKLSQNAPITFAVDPNAEFSKKQLSQLKVVGYIKKHDTKTSTDR